MFKALLLATVAGVGAASPPLPASELNARSNNPPSYLCSNVKQKCAGPKAKESVTAYCSSLLKIPVVTKTKRTTIVSTGSTTITKTVATVTQPGSIVTSTVTCVPPTTTVVQLKREAEPQQGYGYGYGQNTVHKPSCLATYKKAAEITSACKCESITPRTTTVTSTIKMSVKSTATVSATSTVTGDATTTYVIATESSYAVADESGRYYEEFVLGKDDGFGYGFNTDRLSLALLFELNNDNLVTSDGRVAAELADEDDVSDDEDDIQVQPVYPSQITSGQYKAITCSISYEPTENVCPLVCQYSSPADRNLTPQGSDDVSWLLGPPNTVNEDSTYKTYAVSRSRVTRGGSSIGRTMRRRA